MDAKGIAASMAHGDAAISQRSHSLRALRVSSRSVLDADDAFHRQYHEHVLDATPAFVQLENRSFQSSSWLQTTAQSLCIGLTRLHRAIDAAGSSSLPKKDQFSALSSRFTGSCKSTTRFYRANATVFYREILCGLAATLLMIPETVAFSYVANLDPLVGLYATGIFGLVVGFLGGVPSTVAGAAGALAVVMPQLTSATGALAALSYEQRVQHLFVAVFLAGVFQLFFGIFELSRFFSMIPRTAHIGFLNGLAIMMLLSQKTTLEVCTDPSLRFGQCEQQGKLAWMQPSDPATWTTVFTIVITMVVMHFFPRVPRIGRVLPPTLVVAIVGVGFEFGINRPLLGYDVRTIGDTSPLAGAFPSLVWPQFSGVQDWSAVLSCAASLAMVGIFESIMTLQAVVDLHKTQLSREACRRECVAQGVGNIVCGVFQAMGGCSMIGQSTGNVLNGARHRLSAVVMGVAMFMIILFGSAVIELVPVACLTGILLVIIAHTFYWPSLPLLLRLKTTDALAIVLVTTLAAVINLAVAVIAGVVWQSLVNGWASGQQLSATTSVELVDITVDNQEPQSVDAKVYHIKGTLLYSSVMGFRSLFDFVNDPQVVIVDLRECHFADFSAVAALKEAATRYEEYGKTLAARHLDLHATDLVVHRDLGWQLHDQVLVHTSGSSTTTTADDDHAPRSPFHSVRAVVTPRSPDATAPYHVLPE